MEGLVITKQQAMTLATLAIHGPATVTALGLPDRPGVIVAHYPACSAVVDESGAVTSRGSEAVA